MSRPRIPCAMSGSKTCTKCGAIKPLSEFYATNRSGKTKPHSQCYECGAAAVRRKREALRALNPSPRPTLMQRFMANVIPVTESGCWLWTGDVSTKKGEVRARIKHGGKTRVGARVAYELHVGPIPDGLLVCHRCDVPLCVNPKHLFLGTHADNVRDCENKGRRWHQRNPDEVKDLLSRYRAAPHQIARGERVSQSKLTAEDVVSIRKLAGAKVKSMAELARDHGLTHAAVRAVVNRVTWRHVP